MQLQEISLACRRGHRGRLRLVPCSRMGRRAQVYQLMEVGAAARMTGATKLNERSSRSHAVFILIVEQARGPGGGAAGDEMDQFRGVTPGACPQPLCPPRAWLAHGCAGRLPRPSQLPRHNCLLACT